MSRIIAPFAFLMPCIALAISVIISRQEHLCMFGMWPLMMLSLRCYNYPTPVSLCASLTRIMWVIASLSHVIPQWLELHLSSYWLFYSIDWSTFPIVIVSFTQLHSMISNNILDSLYTSLDLATDSYLRVNWLKHYFTDPIRPLIHLRH